MPKNKYQVLRPLHNTQHHFIRGPACATPHSRDLRPQSKGGDIRIRDILVIRSGFVDRNYELSSEGRYKSATQSCGDLCFARLSHKPALRDWLHDRYFADVTGDLPMLEAWPVPEHDYSH
ncbi:hypothetical protein N7475_007453 [Penicillium sp. IBT 31633x]|nr:hypothetical protein N7475_007453 [Penicillium sp. IBT 31633x]